MAPTDMLTCQPAKLPTAQVDTAPSSTPMAPPIRLSVTASMRNCARMSRPRAPTAMRRPISRVRSVTLTSMMFMMPMPPMIRLMPATAASSSVITRLASSCACRISDRLRTLKVSSPPGGTFRRWRSRSRTLSSTAFMSCPSRTLMLMLQMRLTLPPAFQMRLRKVDMGMITVSSWSCPMLFWPLRASTPITVNGTPRTRITWSIGSSSPNSSRATVCPSHTTLAEPDCSAASNRRPLSSDQSRTSR